MKNIIILLFTIISIVGMAQNPTITLVSDVWPPFTNTAEEKSIANELVQEALRRMDITSTITIEAFSKVLPDLQNNNFSGSGALWKVSEREAYLFFSKPYLQNQLMLVSKKGVEVNGLTINDLETKRIGIVKGYAYADSLVNNPNIELITSESDQRNVEKLFANEIDYLLVDALVLSYMMKYEMNNVTSALEVANTPFETKNLHFVLNKQVANAPEIMIAFNQEIQEMIKDGSYHKILGMQWIEADVNNDGVPELVLQGDAAGELSPEEAYKLFYDEQPAVIGAAEKQFFIDGIMYANWEDVPDRYKSNPVNVPTPESYSPGIRIKF